MSASRLQAGDGGGALQCCWVWPLGVFLLSCFILVRMREMGTEPSNVGGHAHWRVYVVVSSPTRGIRVDFSSVFHAILGASGRGQEVVNRGHVPLGRCYLCRRAGVLWKEHSDRELPIVRLSSNYGQNAV